MANILDNLFGSSVRLKIIRLFYMHPEAVFARAEVMRRAKSSVAPLNRELALLKKIGFIKDAVRFEEEPVRRRKKMKKQVIARGKRRKPRIVYGYKIVTQVRRKKVAGFQLNPLFPFLGALKGLVLDTTPVSREALLKKIKKLGRVQLVILSGVFLKENESRVDILIVGDSIKRGALEKMLHGIEAEVGKELNYALFETKEFMYRLGMYDKFVRDILDYPHEKILNKLDI